MPKLDFSTKRMQINQANVTVVTVVSVAVFVTIFSLIAVNALWSQRGYQSRVIAAREKANDQLKENTAAADQLTEQYKQFVSSTTNAIGGNPTGSGERDGDNARIVLDALPSKYDFPALTTSLEKLSKSQSLVIESIGGVDDELNQAVNSEDPVPQPVEMPFDLTVNGNYASIQQFVGLLEKSIRPFNVNVATFTAAENGSVSLELDAKTYYQPEKGLKFKSEVVK